MTPDRETPGRERADRERPVRERARDQRERDQRETTTGCFDSLSSRSQKYLRHTHCSRTSHHPGNLCVCDRAAFPACLVSYYSDDDSSLGKRVVMGKMAQNWTLQLGKERDVCQIMGWEQWAQRAAEQNHSVDKSVRFNSLITLAFSWLNRAGTTRLLKCLREGEVHKY